MEFLVRGLWIEYEIEKGWNPNSDTSIFYSNEELLKYYASKPIDDSLFTNEPKYFEETAKFFESKTGLIRSKTHYELHLISVLDKQLIKNWTAWYQQNRKRIKLKELKRIVH